MASKLILIHHDYNKNEIQNAVVQNLASAPSSPHEGQIYYDTTLHQLGVYQNSTWTYLSATVTNGVTKTSNASGAGVIQVSGGADKTIADYTSAGGIVKVNASGVASIASAGTDYLTASSTNTFTNKTFDAAGTGNALSNISTSNFAVNVIDTDTTLAANSDTRLASQKAVKTYIDGVATSAMKFKGVIDASTNPNYPSASTGDMYKISVAGKIGGASGTVVTAGDSIVAITNTSAGNEATVGANWDVIQANVDAATSSTLGLTQYATSTEAEAKSSSSKSLTPASVTNFPVKKTATIGDGSSTSIAVTHNLGTQDIVASIRDATTNAFVECDIVATSTTVATFNFAVAPASNAYKVTIIG